MNVVENSRIFYLPGLVYAKNSYEISNLHYTYIHE